MKIYKLKSAARRGSMLGAAFAIVAASFVPVASSFADALNPLTDRSLTLSSSAPGWDYLDGSGNATYSPPNSGANGQKVGNTFDFKVSTDTSSGATNVKAFTFQYCTTPAGNCTAPGDNGWSGSGPYTRIQNGPAAIAAKHSDLEVVIAGDTDTSQGTMATYVTDNDADPDGTNPNGVVSTIPARDATGNNFIVYYINDNATPADLTDDIWAPSTGWTMTVENAEDGDPADGPAGTPKATGTNNQIVLKNSTGQGFKAGTRVKVVFFATDTNYITNPGSGAFFVRMNTYDSDTTLTDSHVIDGGVTVANVMNLGIQITTKVLETMDFSVGVVDPYTLQAAVDDTDTAGTDESETSQLFLANGHKKHSVCEPILTKFYPSDLTSNRLQLGDSDAEFSLRTDTTYSTHSYWRLSSNSSAGATVYYSGNTLTNTVEDTIDAIGSSPEAPLPGSEQFGLALANGTSGVYAVNYNTEREPVDDQDYGVFENGVDTDSAVGGNVANGLVDPLASGIDGSVTSGTISNLALNPSWHSPQLAPLVPSLDYANGAGVVNARYGTVNTQFAFDPNSTLIPVEIASENDQVVNCVTGKMRYIANIAATTPAGIYTTKINYIAAPQY